MRVPTILILLFVSLARAACAEPLPDAEHRTLESFAETNKTCREWTDGCAICLRHDATFDCSLPGIACQPTALVCKAETPDFAPAPAK